jgi:chemotaxis protein methyltransferase CheR
MNLSDSEFNHLAEFIETNTGIHLPEQKKVLLVSRLQMVLDELGLRDFDTYYKLLVQSKDPSLVVELVNRITTNHTYFYREEKHFEFLREAILPSIKLENTDCDVRIWSAGCSTGEEPYTLTMSLFEFFGLEISRWNTEILATDISIDALRQGQRGIFRAQQLDKLPKEWLRKYFKIHDEGYEAKTELKQNVVFKKFNLMDPFPFKKKFDVIFCRNVMIYFNQEVRKKLIQKYADALKIGGYLIIGHSETIDKSIQNLSYVQPSIYRRK